MSVYMCSSMNLTNELPAVACRPASLLADAFCLSVVSGNCTGCRPYHFWPSWLSLSCREKSWGPHGDLPGRSEVMTLMPYIMIIIVNCMLYIMIKNTSIALGPFHTTGRAMNPHEEMTPLEGLTLELNADVSARTRSNGFSERAHPSIVEKTFSPMS